MKAIFITLVSISIIINTVLAYEVKLERDKAEISLLNYNQRDSILMYQILENNDLKVISMGLNDIVNKSGKKKPEYIQKLIIKQGLKN